MPASNKPYEQFGSFILLKKIDADALGELWRATRLEEGKLGPVVALRRFRGAGFQSLAGNVEAARRAIASMSGISFVKSQSIDSIAGTPYLEHDYAGGRSVRHIVLRARGSNGVTAHPMPIDQALAIAERVALSLATTAEMRVDGRRLSHGALLPHFVWITEGEIRIAGQQLGGGLLSALSDSRVAAEVAPYFSPESRASGDASKTSDVFSLGALLYFLVTGQEPPDGTAGKFDDAVRTARTMSGEPVPDEIRAVIGRSLALDPAARYASIAEMKQELSALTHGGKFSATTFNLAFYVSTLLKKEFEGEVLEREREAKVNPAAYAEVAPVAAPFASAAEEREPRSVPSAAIAAAVVAVAVLAAGSYFMFGRRSGAAPPAAPQPKPAVVAATAAPPPTTATFVSQPLVATGTAPAAASPAAPAVDEAAQKQAFEAAVEQKLREEMMKLQAEYTTRLQKQKSKDAPLQIAQASPPARSAEPERDVAASAQLDQQRLASLRDSGRDATQLGEAAAAATQAAAASQPAAAAPQPVAAPTVHEGDVVGLADLDTPPHVIRGVAPAYPPLALKQRLEATILVTALVSENGEVLDVKVLRGDKRFGFEDAAVRAVRSTRFSPAMKSGKRVKTWFPLPVTFKIQPT